jgi:ribosome-binding factor A
VYFLKKAGEILEAVKSNAKNIKHDLSQRVRLQLRKCLLVFFIDDSLDYIEKIDNALANRTILLKTENC